VIRRKRWTSTSRTCARASKGFIRPTETARGFRAEACADGSRAQWSAGRSIDTGSGGAIGGIGEARRRHQNSARQGLGSLAENRRRSQKRFARRSRHQGSRRHRCLRPTAKTQCTDAVAELELLGKTGALSDEPSTAQIANALRGFRKELTRPNTFQKKLDKLPVPKIEPRMPLQRPGQVQRPRAAAGRARHHGGGCQSPTRQRLGPLTADRCRPQEEPLDEAALKGLAAIAANAPAAKTQCTDAIAELEQLGKTGALSDEPSTAQIANALRAFRKELTRPNAFQKKLDKLPVPKVEAPAPVAGAAADKAKQTVKAIPRRRRSVTTL